MRAQFKTFSKILLITLIPTLLVWLPFFFRLKSFWYIPLPQEGMATIVANYDGPLYIVVAKSLYNIAKIQNFPFTLPAVYYAAHFPLYPIAITLSSFLVGNFPYSMLVVTVLSSILAIYFFMKLVGEYVEKKDVLWMAFVFSIFPARWLIVRSVGSPEPLFIAGIIASVYYFKKEKYWAAGIWGAIAQLTKSPGMLLFISYLAIIFLPKIKKAATTDFSHWVKSIKVAKYLPLLLMPISLFGIFYLYKLTYGDFFAYFHSGDNIHLFFPPFQIFNYSADWVGTFWLEEIIFIYLFGFLGIQKLIQKKDVELSWISAIFFASTLFVAHRDLLRYSLPILPFILISFSDSIVKKEFKSALLLLIIPIYLFALAYISQNVMPVSDWASLL
ncbi:hypothetical protein A2115_02155 [Candidatus Woesebacteria bacterium GWA1_41_8]|jgi:Gpi18-like mannosyltransferase|uniref:Glycosyltransferase RgtA/B/C/D-like domain-containing protein n=1 Tax=Candidatus Woesebacteria bacterium GWA1_41_8 TaxID=1802471 RepID=A0A1F7WIU3_9BACT|nr:MAG: hypothetical protein A2115_02155 [Candidatus Woesebacteria bacterium GWA1_41_8]